ncbi:MAG: M56 family metallopeptidase [Planctomycetota bacterium]
MPTPLVGDFEMLLPSTLVVLGSIGVLAVALRAVGMSPRDRAGDRSFVLASAIASSLLLFVLGLIYRNAVWITPGGDPVIEQVLRVLPVSVQSAFLVVWAVVAVTIAARYAMGFASVQLIAWRGAVVERGSRVAGAADEVAHELGVARRVPIVVSRGCASPFAFGVLRPVVVLPELAEYWPRDQIRAVLLHEFAHIRRHDLLVQLVTQLALAACWWNPLCWLAARRLRDLRESACDELVLARFARVSWYARLLVRLRRPSFGSAGLAFATMHMASRSTLRRRIRALRRRGERQLFAALPTFTRGDVVGVSIAWVLAVMLLEGWLSSLAGIDIPLLRAG